MTETSRVVYRPRESATLEAELSALAAIYAFILNKKAAEPAPDPDRSNDAAMVTNGKGVSHVEQRPDRSLEVT
jgi:hypothetical protein